MPPTLRRWARGELPAVAANFFRGGVRPARLQHEVGDPMQLENGVQPEVFDADLAQTIENRVDLACTDATTTQYRNVRVVGLCGRGAALERLHDLDLRL